MSNIFISYASEDRDNARQLAGALQSLGWSVWWDRTIPAGRTFSDVIDEALEEAQCVIVIWSKIAVKKNWVLEEAQDGLERSILVPAFIDRVKPPRGFRRIQAADLIDWDGAITAGKFQRLVSAVALILGPALADDERQKETAEEGRRQQSEAERKAEEEQRSKAEAEAARKAGEQERQIAAEAKRKAKEERRQQADASKPLARGLSSVLPAKSILTREKVVGAAIGFSVFLGLYGIAIIKTPFGMFSDYQFILLLLICASAGIISGTLSGTCNKTWLVTVVCLTIGYFFILTTGVPRTLVNLFVQFGFSSFEFCYEAAECTRDSLSEYGFQDKSALFYFGATLAGSIGAVVGAVVGAILRNRKIWG